MSISITTSNEIFNNNQNLMIIFSAFDGEIRFEKRDDCLFIYNKDDTVIGINIFNYKSIFSDIVSGYHEFSDINFKKLVHKYPIEMHGVINTFNFKIGLITKIDTHPKSDKLKVLCVKTNDNEIKIVTNIMDLIKGNKYLFAMENTLLATGVIINKSKVMGVESHGMICSYKSIGINKEGIILIDNQDIKDRYEF
ncbi:MAG: hypothetical protein KFW07_03910 [Mycoplasmataceae bacterium]|nr:hypothetical protein [Mycoplasmataceae bacterium]